MEVLMFIAMALAGALFGVVACYLYVFFRISGAWR